jgi:mannose-6-phosphate isomerase-like protein (cupin superfamily)
MRLMVALRVAFMGPGREETSFLFLVDGGGREGLGLHHDDEVHAFWLQLEGRRTVTRGRPVPRGTPQEIADRDVDHGDFTTRALAPGSLLYLPPRTPHRVVCYERSVALSLTWSVARRPGRRAESLAAWDVVSGRVPIAPASSRTRVWGQVPAIAAGVTATATTLMLPDGERVRVPGVTRVAAHHLALMASFPRGALGRALPALEARGVVGAQELPLVVVPDAPAALDGWRFA